MTTLKEHIATVWPKFLDWLNREVEVEKIIENPIGVTSLRREYFVSHSGLNINSTDGEYEIFFSVRIECIRIGDREKE